MPTTKLSWTGSKVALIELVYALQTEGVFNNGNADLKEIIENFEQIFSIDLGQFNRVFLVIRIRKSSPTKFFRFFKGVFNKPY
ncbi:RteC domain-containing protein [Chryseobacterium profundimaris]|uniref:RteC domain-containing protein n=1 Tax=Chryseobacterium profundimaris TaxID=1387275 RepID=UPI003D26CBBA